MRYGEAKQRFNTRKRQTRRADKVDKDQNQPKDKKNSNQCLPSHVELPFCWRGKSPLRTEAIPTSPDRV